MMIKLKTLNTDEISVEAMLDEITKAGHKEDEYNKGYHKMHEKINEFRERIID